MAASGNGRAGRWDALPGRLVWGRSGKPSLLALCLIAAFLFVWPVVMVVYGAFRTAAPGLAGGRWSAHAFADAFGDAQTLKAIWTTVLLSLAVLAISTTLAIFLAWTVARTNTPGRRLVTPMMLIVFAIPPLFFTLSWAMLGQQPVGALNKLYQLITGSDGAPINMQSWYGMISVEVMKATAAEYLLLLGPFLALDSSLEEAARVAGSGRLKTFLRIELPLLAPAIVGVLILGFILGLSLLDVPLLLGIPAGIHVLPTEIYTFINGHTPPDYAGASAIAVLLIVIVLVLVVIQWRVLGRRSYTTVTGRSQRRDRIDLGRWRWLGCAVIALFGILALILPVGQFVLGSLESYFGVYNRLGFEHYRQVFDTPDVFSAFKNTLLVGAAAGFIASALAVWISLVAQRSTSRLRRLPELSVWMLWAIPGITLGLGVTWAYLSVPGLKSLYSTEWMVLIALVIGTTPIASRAVGGAVVQVGREVEEAARIAGASGFRATVGILVPLILPSFLAAWFIAAVLAAGNLDITILLASPNTETVPVVAFNSYSNGDLATAAALFCLLLAAILIVLLAGVLVAFAVRRLRARAARIATAPAPGAPAQPTLIQEGA